MTAPHERFRWRSFGDVLAARAAEKGEAVAFTFVTDDGAEDAIGFAELDRQARALAALLQDLGASGERALLLFPPGVQYLIALFACLRGGVVGVPAYHPARLNRTVARLASMIEDARPAVVLTNAQTRAAAERLFEQAPALKKPQWIALAPRSAAPRSAGFQPAAPPASSRQEEPGRQDAGGAAGRDAGAPHAEAAFREPDSGPDTLALLQYTSGSTSAPRGVMVTHGNLLHNSGFICAKFGHTSASQGVIWLPPYHDMGLIGGILQPVYAGFPCTLMSPMTFVQRPIRWLEAVSKYRGTTSGGPNFAYEACLKRIAPEQCEGLDLSSWDVAFNGAEPVRADTLENFARTFAPFGFRAEALYPCYGLAEATLAVTGGRKMTPAQAPRFSANDLQERRAQRAQEDDGAPRLVACGDFDDAQRVLIVDPEALTECAPGRIGEIWVQGPSIARGYWERPEETAHTFGGRLPGIDGTFLRTGDLGFFDGGQLFVTGRLKDILIVRGRNYYPHDVERASWESHPALRPFSAAAFTIPIRDTERLVVVQEVDGETPGDPNDVLWAIRRGVADAVDLQVHTVVLVGPRGVPMTPSGKVQRSLCRRLFLDQQLEQVSRWSLPEETSA